MEDHFTSVGASLDERSPVEAKLTKTNLLQSNAPFHQKSSCKEVDQISSQKSKMRANLVIPSEGTHSSLELFEKPPLLVTFDQAFEQKTGPLYSPTGSSLEFEIVGDRNNFIDLQKIYLEVKCCIVQSNGNNLRYTTGDANASDTPFFVNYILHSLFADCTVSANGNKISSANGHYAHKCFIETEFSHGSDAKSTWLKCQGCEYESDPNTIPNATIAQRELLFLCKERQR